MHKHYRKIAAGLLAAAMIVPTTVSIAEPLSVSAYELLGESTFDYKMIPWHTAEALPAKQTFAIQDGALNIKIIVPEGADKEKWDLMLRHRNLDFIKGHEYKVSFKAKALREGMELTARIGNIKGDEDYFVLDGESDDMHMGPHMDGMWPSKPVKLGTEWKTYEGTFIPTQDLDDCEWCFQYAKGTKYFGNAIQGDEIWFDDMSIYDMSDDMSDYTVCTPPPTSGYTIRANSGLDNNYISVNQLGYYQGLAKIATLGDNAGDIVYGTEHIELEGSYEFEIVSTSDDTVFYTGVTTKPVKDKDSGDNICKIDFTDFDNEGEYYIRIKGKEWRSFPFRIGDDIYSDKENDILTNSLNYFYQNRSGIDIDKEYITSGNKDTLAHKGGHKNDTGYVQNQWQREYLNNSDAKEKYASSELTASGGWYASDNHRKDMIEGGIALWTLQNMYERATNYKEGIDKFEDGSGTVVVPETGNNVPDILDECRYELDFMSKMKVQPDEETWGKYAGMYYHRIQDDKWTGLALRPWDYSEEYDTVRIIRPPTFAATLNYAACAAQGARLWQPYDAAYAEKLLQSAKEAYDAYEKNWYDSAPDEEYNSASLYAPRNVIGTAAPGDDEVRDDAYWAACELFVSASVMGDSDADKYHKDLSGYKNAFKVGTRITGGGNERCEGSFTMFNTGNTAAAGSLSLLLNMKCLNDNERVSLKESVICAANEFIYCEEAQGYGIPYHYDGPGYSDLGDLPSDIMIDGFEYNSNERALNNMIAMAFAYDVTWDKKYLNGIVNGMDYLLGNNPLSFSYITGYGSYHAKNPTHRYWSYEVDKTLPKAPDGVIVSGATTDIRDLYSRGLGMLAFHHDDPSERYYVDSVEAWSSNSASLSSNASFAWIVSFLQDQAPYYALEQKADGDVNGDGSLNVADIVLIQRWLLGNDDVYIRNWKAADFCKDGKINVFDLCCMRKEIIKAGIDYVVPDKKVVNGNYLSVVADGLKMYLGPDESYEAVAILPKRSWVREYGYMDGNDVWMFAEHEDKCGWIRVVAEDGKTPTIEHEKMIDKPVIYLYPEEETDVHVELELTESELSTTYPRYNNGWDVVAYPDGKLLNKSDGTHHRYLFWDSAKCCTEFDLSKGFCVVGSDTESFLREKLTYMGLTEEEMNEFIVYWLPRMEHNAYNLIAFQGDVYTNSAKLDITPSPDSVCRVFMAYVPLDNAVDIEPQQLETFERKGFAVVEWGGTEIR